MTNQEKKDYLLQYRDAREQVNRLNLEIERWRSIAEKMTTSFLATGSGGNTGRKVEDAVIQIDRLTVQLAERVAAAAVIRGEIDRSIAGLEDPRLRKLMELRYVDGMSWPKVADQMDIELRWLFRLHGRALNDLTIESHYPPVV